MESFPVWLKGVQKGENREKKQDLKITEGQEGELQSSDIKADFSPTGNGILHSCGGIKAPK